MHYMTRGSVWLSGIIIPNTKYIHIHMYTHTHHKTYHATNVKMVTSESGDNGDE